MEEAALEPQSPSFSADERIGRDSILITTLGLCQLRLQNDSRWPWLVLLPQRPDVSEVFDLTPLDQAVLTFETNMVAKALKDVTGATKINTAAIGNIVRQLHVHIIARNEGDTNWPGPVWGHGTAVAWNEAEREDFISKLTDAL